MRFIPWFLALLISAAAAAEPAPRPNILLIVLDTLRYDATTNDNMPFLTSLASRGVVFTNAYSTHDFTPTSHFSMFTGLRDGLATDDDRLENGLPHQLRRAGYHTFATVANSLIGPKQMPTFRGFDSFKEPGDVTAGTILDALGATTEIDFRLALFRCRPTPHMRAMLYYSADRLLQMFLEQIKAAKPPYFGFVNIVDPHEPYIPDPQIYPPERTLPPGFDGDVLARRLGPELANPDAIADPQRRAYVKSKIAQAGAKSLVAVDLSPEARTIYRQRYRAKVRGTDATLRLFFATLDRQNLLENTVVIITSDHGESFGESDLITHMFGDRGDFESTHHVPLLIALPPKMRAATRVIDRKVSIANLAPTIYDLAGVDWAGFKSRYEHFPPSLASLVVAGPVRYVAKVLVPTPARQDHTEAEKERAKALKALGYVH